MRIAYYTPDSVVFGGHRECFRILCKALHLVSDEVLIRLWLHYSKLVEQRGITIFQNEG